MNKYKYVSNIEGKKNFYKGGGRIEPEQVIKEIDLLNKAIEDSRDLIAIYDRFLTERALEEEFERELEGDKE